MLSWFLLKRSKSPSTGLCVVTTWLYSIKRKTSLKCFLYSCFPLCCGDKWKWNIFCGLSSLSCMDTYLQSQGEDSPLPFVAEKIFYKWKNGGFFFSFSWATMTKMEVSGHWHAQKQTSFVPWAWKPLFKQDTSTLLTGCKAVVSLQDYFWFYTFFAWEPGSFLKLDPIFVFSSVGLTDPLRWC